MSGYTFLLPSLKILGFSLPTNFRLATPLRPYESKHIPKISAVQKIAALKPTFRCFSGYSSPSTGVSIVGYSQNRPPYKRSYL